METQEIKEHSIICILSILTATCLLYAAYHLDLQVYQDWLNYFKL